MRNNIKKNGRWYFNLVLVLVIPILSGFTSASVIETSCPGPQVSVTNHTAGSASFVWSPVSGASEYVVFYIRQDDQFTSQQTYTSGTSITYSGLLSGTYDFYFATVCGSEYSSWIIVEDLVM